MKFQTKTIVSAANVANAIASEVIDLRYNYGLAVQCTFTGSPTGSVLIEGSNDGTIWSQISSLSISGTNTLSANVDGLYWPWVRVSKASGGTGTMTTTITIKGA